MQGLRQLRVGLIGLGLGLALTAGLIRADMPDVLQVGAFSRAQAGGPYPEPWKPLTFKQIEQHTHYSLVQDNGTVVVRAESHGSSSGLTREITIDPRIYPIVEWRWKIDKLLQNSDVTQKTGDDYPARLYITFAYDRDKVGFFERAKYETIRFFYGQYPPSGAINYIWESNSPVGTTVANPYTDRVQMIVLESGPARVGQWVTESRNIYQDHRRAFGEDPPLISGVAVMTDTDNTNDSAIAWFGDIVFKSAPE